MNFNENIASFIAHKATIQFLKEDTVSLYVYLTLKKSATKDDLKDIGKLLKDLSYTFKTYRDRR